MRALEFKCTKSLGRRGSAPDPAGGAYSTPPGSLAGFRGRARRERDGKRVERGSTERVEGREKRREGREGGERGVGLLHCFKGDSRP